MTDTINDIRRKCGLAPIREQSEPINVGRQARDFGKSLIEIGKAMREFDDVGENNEQMQLLGALAEAVNLLNSSSHTFWVRLKRGGAPDDVLDAIRMSNKMLSRAYSELRAPLEQELDQAPF